MDDDSEQLSLLDLPTDILLRIINGMQMSDILNLAKVHPILSDLVLTNKSIWVNAGFINIWPDDNNKEAFEKASECGNIAAAIKLSLAYLYNEGLDLDISSDFSMMSFGNKVAKLLSTCEKLTPNIPPFTWIFIRPPWNVKTKGKCCKAVVYNCLENNYLTSSSTADIKTCLARIVSYITPEIPVDLLIEAANMGEDYAILKLWDIKYQAYLDAKYTDTALELEAIRKLRSIVKQSNLRSKTASLKLLYYYARRKYGGISETTALDFCRSEFRRNCFPLCYQKKLNSHITQSMRYILVDWLVELTNIKCLKSDILHRTVCLVDTVLKCRIVSRSELQLVGIASMLLVCRYEESDILTIREAAWLTDNTYMYGDVVRMIGEITAITHGKLLFATSIDYCQSLNIVANLTTTGFHMLNYLLEVSLHYFEFSAQFSQATVACAACLLVLITQSAGNTIAESLWTNRLVTFTGFTVDDLKFCAQRLHTWYTDNDPFFDHRKQPLTQVFERYKSDEFGCVSLMKSLSHLELCNVLSLNCRYSNKSVRFQTMENGQLIMSPTRGGSGATIMFDNGRHLVATPTIEQNESVFKKRTSDHEPESVKKRFYKQIIRE